ncbi:hypothetical protein EJ05DRAFT_5354 [Pseudovirgaria hyperparasitica]|uniref:Uncharacterized protein n=1 Tax=Pseudovirgaria hyperparasitica TaxID=470096 RepID=A0A6A6WJQ5_9PEZI|nr:uncharacterized protein EJ05DRAFT_5354 [Pseudovirgaria hyperparasitica]KAF2762544.1 hypothetical protein EJ05DRAFT_5354 [Pseudovirgaria hyperparasitica]
MHSESLLDSFRHSRPPTAHFLSLSCLRHHRIEEKPLPGVSDCPPAQAIIRPRARGGQQNPDINRYSAIESPALPGYEIVYWFLLLRDISLEPIVSAPLFRHECCMVPIIFLLLIIPKRYVGMYVKRGSQWLGATSMGPEGGEAAPGSIHVSFCSTRQGICRSSCGECSEKLSDHDP